MKSLRQTLLDDSPVLLWMIDELSGTLYKDITVNADHGGMSGSPLLGVPGPVPGALAASRFNGSSQSVNRDVGIGTITAVFPLGSAARTLEIWARPTAGGNYCGLAYGEATSTGEHVNFLIGGSPCFTDGVNVGNNKNWTTPATVSTWGHFAMTYAGGAGGVAIFYRNGVADTTTTLTLATTSSIGKLRAGLRSDDGRATQYFTGDLAVASVYSTALSAARIREHYLAGIGTKPNLLVGSSSRRRG